jgi:hypothetical protein
MSYYKNNYFKIKKAVDIISFCLNQLIQKPFDFSILKNDSYLIKENKITVEGINAGSNSQIYSSKNE